MKGKYDILIFIFAFVVLLAIGLTFYSLLDIQKKYDEESVERKTISTSTRYLCGISNDSLKKRTEYQLVRTETDSIIEFTYKSKTDSSRNFNAHFKKHSFELVLSLEEYKIAKPNHFESKIISKEAFDSYELIDPVIDGMGPILFNASYGFLAIGNPLGPAAAFMESKPEFELVDEIFEKLY